MDRRERLLTTINHREPDRVPMGFDQTSEEIIQKIFRYYGVQDMERFYEKTGVDGFAVWRFHAAAMPDYVGPPRKYITNMDPMYGFWGKIREYVYPLFNEELDTYHFPQANEFDFSTLKAKLTKIRDNGMTTTVGHAGVGFLHHVQMRSYDRIFYDLMDDAWMETYMNLNRAFFVPYFENIFKYADGLIDIVRADEDLGSMDRMLLSPGMWRKWYKPLWKEVFDICKKHGAKIWMHSCGYCRPILDDFLEIGVDILNPIPPYVKDSDPLEMKQTYGKILVLDGGVDQMNVLVGGTPQMVDQEVKLRIEQCAPDGGFILSPSQGFTNDISMQNMAAFFEAGIKYGQY